MPSPPILLRWKHKKICSNRRLNVSCGPKVVIAQKSYGQYWDMEFWGLFLVFSRFVAVQIQLKVHLLDCSPKHKASHLLYHKLHIACTHTDLKKGVKKGKYGARTSQERLLNLILMKNEKEKYNHFLSRFLRFLSLSIESIRLFIYLSFFEVTVASKAKGLCEDTKKDESQ